MSRVLEGRSALITGANQGLGFAIARAYVRAGANVLICARQSDLLDQAHADLLNVASPEQIITSRSADVSRPDDVENLASFALHTFGQVHILVNNAGIYGPKGNIEHVDWEEWVRAIE